MPRACAWEKLLGTCALVSDEGFLLNWEEIEARKQSYEALSHILMDRVTFAGGEPFGPIRIHARKAAAREWLHRHRNPDELDHHEPDVWREAHRLLTVSFWD